MTFRAPLIVCNTNKDPYVNEINDSVFSLLTDAQLAWFARVSVRHGKDVEALLRFMKPMAEQEGDSDRVTLYGLLPNCGLYGCLCSDGTSHT